MSVEGGIMARSRKPGVIIELGKTAGDLPPIVLLRVTLKFRGTSLNWPVLLHRQLRPQEVLPRLLPCEFFVLCALPVPSQL